MSQQQLPNANLAVERFRILVIGNANAGKTTILDKVCHAQGREPDCFDTNGNKTASELKPSALRGEHDIEDNFQYPTAHGFVFHDSRGFEAGGANELDKVKDFIIRRAERELLKDQLHAIWYCLSTSNDRAMTAAEMSLFESGTGNVPVIAIFTKMDALEERAFNQLLNEGASFEEADSKAPSLAKDIFERSYLRPLTFENVKNKPAYIVQLRDMDKEGANCDELIVRTSEALNGETLRLFCLSILRNDIESRIKHVINRIIIPMAQEAHESGSFSDEQAKTLFCKVMCYFPYMLPSFDNLIRDMDKNAVNATSESVEGRDPGGLRGGLDPGGDRRRDDRRLRLRDEDRDDLNENHLKLSFKSILQSMMSQPSYPRAVWIGIITVAIADLCLFSSHSRFHADFQKALGFCLHASSYPNLMSVVEKAYSITDADVVRLLGILKGNRDCYKPSKQ